MGNPGEDRTLGANGNQDASPSAPPFQPAPGMLRRLTRSQFSNALSDLLPGAQIETNELDTDDWTGNFAVIGAAVVSTSSRGVEQFHAAIEGAVSATFADPSRRSQLLRCTPTGAGNDACLRDYIRSLGARAWRRPVESEAVARLLAIAAKATAELGGPLEGARWATLALLSSPNFLYRPELGAASSAGAALRLTGDELAGRLAFLIWNSVPDKVLLDQAAAGALDSSDGVRAAAQRMLEAPQGREAVTAFAEEFLRLDRIATLAKDPQLFPEYTPTLQAAMVRDMREAWAMVAFDEDANLLGVFTTTKAVVNSELATLYGLDATGLTAASFEPRVLPGAGPRVGVLGKAGFLAQWANQKEGSPTLRGRFMRESLMCGTVPPPPPNVNTMLKDPPIGQHQTKRQRLELHRSEPACAGCHALMDPLGLPFENFDALGRYRTTDDTLPIDPSGEFNGRVVADARSLAQALAVDDAVARCLVRKYYSYAVGHPERAVDAGVVNALFASFQASGFNFRRLVLDVVSSDAFASVLPQP